MGADPLDHAGTQILLDPFQCAWQDHFHVVGLELQAVSLVVMPGTDTVDEFAGGNGRGIAYHGDQLPLPPDLDP